MTQARIEVPAAKIAALCRRYHVRSLALFGSALRDDFGPSSDVDLLVEFEPDARIGFLALARMQRELTALFGRPVDLVPKAGLKPLIRETVLSDAELVYAS